MKNKKSRVITILLILIAIFSVAFPLCTMNKIILPIEKYKIEMHADDIIEDYFSRFLPSKKKERIVENSIEVHTIQAIDDEVIIMFSLDTKSLRPEAETLDKNYHGVALFSLMKVHSKNGYELAGGGWSSTSYPLAPVSSCGDYKLSYGTINDDTISKIQIDYSNGDTISHELNGDNYYLIKYPETTGFINILNLRAYDKNDNLIYEKYPKRDEP